MKKGQVFRLLIVIPIQLHIHFHLPQIPWRLGTKVKVNFALWIYHERTGALEKGSWLTPRPVRFTPGKEIGYPLWVGLEDGLDEYGTPPTTGNVGGGEPQTTQTVASRYTNRPKY